MWCFHNETRAVEIALGVAVMMACAVPLPPGARYDGGHDGDDVAEVLDVRDERIDAPGDREADTDVSDVPDAEVTDIGATPSHSAQVASFAMDAYEVTAVRFRAFWTVRNTDLARIRAASVNYPGGRALAWTSPAQPPNDTSALITCNWSNAAATREAHPTNEINASSQVHRRVQATTSTSPVSATLPTLMMGRMRALPPSMAQEHRPAVSALQTPKPSHRGRSPSARTFSQLH